MPASEVQNAPDALFAGREQRDLDAPQGREAGKEVEPTCPLVHAVPGRNLLHDVDGVLPELVLQLRVGLDVGARQDADHRAPLDDRYSPQIEIAQLLDCLLQGGIGAERRLVQVDVSHLAARQGRFVLHQLRDVLA